MTSYIWAVGFDWNETRKAPSDPTRRMATMCISLDEKVVPETNGLYPIDASITDNLDFRLFDRTDWQGKVPPATDFEISKYLVRFGRAAGTPSVQHQSPINTKTFVSEISHNPEPTETTPCFSDEVSKHAWDAGISDLIHNGRYELTISFQVEYNGETRYFLRDPEMEVSGVSG